MSGKLSFKGFCIILAALFTAILFIAIAFLFFVPSPQEIWKSMTSPEMIFSLKLSVITAAVSSAIVMLLGIPIGYALSRFSFFGKSIVKSVIDLPMAFPELVLGLSLLLFFGNTYVSRSFEIIGLKIVFTKLGIVVAQIFTALPYSTRIIYSAFEGVNRRYELVSRSLGYGEFETFTKITLPLAKKGLFASTIIAFARCMGAFGAVLILAGGSYMNTETLPIALYLNMSYGNLGMAITSGIVLIIVSFIAIAIFEKLEGLNAVKS